jgi:hypothetical protein
VLFWHSGLVRDCSIFFLLLSDRRLDLPIDVSTSGSTSQPMAASRPSVVVISTVSLLHGNEWDTLTNDMSTSKNGFGAAGYYTVATRFLFSVFESMFSIMLSTHLRLDDTCTFLMSQTCH